MLVVYVSSTLEPGSGVASKVLATAQQWERCGHSVWLTTARDPRLFRVGDVAERFGTPPAPRGLPERLRGEFAFRVSYPLELSIACARVGVDAVYCRELPPAPGLQWWMRSVPFVLEVNGNLSREMPFSFDRVTRAWSRACQLRDAAGVVFVSRALQRESRPMPEHSLVIGNPCLPSKVPPLGTRPNRPSLVLVGFDRHPWSGMDKFKQMAEALPELDFVVIGAELSGPPNLCSVPKVPQAEVDRLISGCTVGVGPLAPHRQGTTEASPLKSRNYLSLGLPVIQAYEDTDLPGTESCVLQLPNCEANILPHVDRIREFALRAFDDPALARRALELARGPLSLESKEQTRLEFVERCIARRRAA